MANLTYKEMENICDLSKNYFSTLKYSNPKLFKLISKLGKGNLAKGYTKYKNTLNQYSMEMANIYYDLTETFSLSEFYRKMKLQYLYSSESAFIQAVSTMAFDNNERLMRYDKGKKMRIIRKKYNEFKRSN